jgi:hypothetical protein
MTTTVTICIAGNKNCAVRVSGSPHQDCLMEPGTATTFGIHGDQTITVVEHGEFVPQRSPTRPIPETQPPVDNEHVAPGCERFG